MIRIFVLCLFLTGCVSAAPRDLTPDQVAAIGPLLKGERP